MGEKSFMEATTEISNYVGKMNQCKAKIANLLAEAILTRTKTGKTSSLAKDIDNALSDLSAEDKAEVLTQIIVTIAAQNTASPKSDSGRSKNDIFASRKF